VIDDVVRPFAARQPDQELQLQNLPIGHCIGRLTNPTSPCLPGTNRSRGSRLGLPRSCSSTTLFRWIDWQGHDAEISKEK
jgi:hypothetical protein